MNPTIKLVFVGDLCLGGEYIKWSAARQQSLLDPFRGLAPIFQDVDFGVLNLEGPVCNGGSLREGVSVHLSNHPAVFDFAEQNHFRVLSMANNHIMDHGIDGLSATLQLVQARGLVPLGAGANLPEASEPRYIECKGMKVGFLAFTSDEPHIRSVIAGQTTPGCPAYQERQRVLRAVSAARQKADIVCVILHWGIEYFEYPSPDQRDLAHAVIDAGADLVVGHHPHTIQGIEEYKRRLVFYSLGSFFFPPVRTTKKRLQWEKGLAREFGCALVCFGPGGVTGSEFISGSRSRRYQLQLCAGASAAAFDARMARLSEPFTTTSYETFWGNYALKRRRELEKESLAEAFYKLCLNPAAAISNLKFEDFRRNSKRLLKVFRPLLRRSTPLAEKQP